MVYNQLSHALNRRDEAPNIAVAESIVSGDNSDQLAAIVGGLTSNDKRLRSDCMKVIYEISRRKPQLLAEYIPLIARLLHARHNRLVWGAMQTLQALSAEFPEQVMNFIDDILYAYSHGSVIAVDCSMTVLANLANASTSNYVFIYPILLDHIKNCRPKELAQHAERMSVCLKREQIDECIDVLNTRRLVLNNNQQKRIDKLITMIANRARHRSKINQYLV